VVAHGRDADALGRVAEATGGRAVTADLGSPAEVDRLAADASAAFGRIDILINNAGVGWAGSFANMDPAVARDMIAVNVDSPVRLTRALLPPMLERGSGAIVNVASIAGHVGVRNEAVYSATKAALIAFSEGLRYEVSRGGIRVLVVSPGAVATAFFDRRGEPYRRGFPRPISPDRVAQALVWGLRRDRSQVFVPRWLAFPAWLRGAWPSLYRAGAGRFG